MSGDEYLDILDILANEIGYVTIL